MADPKRQFSGPGFVVVFLDIPFPISIPNGAYLTFDPKKDVACIELILHEGSKAFFRNRPIIGPTSFERLKTAAAELERPRQSHSHLVTSRLTTGEEKATLNIHSGADGGYAECKYYSEVRVTFLADDISGGDAFGRACEILNPFLDKYRLLNEDYRVARVSMERNFYFATCHTSPLEGSEIGLTPRELFTLLGQRSRTFYHTVGEGASYILRPNSFELLGPKGSIAGPALDTFSRFIQDKYEMPLSYELIMEALSCLQKLREYRLAVVHAETAFEVHVADRLRKLMAASGMSSVEIDATLESQSYWGVKKRIRRLDDWIKKHSAKSGLPFVAFHGSSLCARWEAGLYSKRNAAVHSGARSFSYDEASTAIGIAKECIVALESRLSPLSDVVQLNPSMAGFHDNAGEVAF